MKKVLTGLLIVIALVTLIGVILPSNIKLSQSILINAPAEMIFEEVNNLKEWKNWSPWHKKDPAAIMTYQGPESGAGCKMMWNSTNYKVGKGSQEIIKSIPNRHIEIALRFGGWDYPTQATWDFEERALDKTYVTWSYTTHTSNNILHKYMATMIKPNLEKDYIKGLQQLKAYVEQKIAIIN